MSEAPNSQRLGITKSELPPCCLRIHPEDTSIIFLGTYKLEKSGERHGSIEVYRYNVANEDETHNLELINKYPTSGAILDIKFDPFDSSRLISAHSTGDIIIWKYTGDGELELLKRAILFDSDSLITSISFCPTTSNKLLATITTGELAIIDLHDLSFDIFQTTHDLECWIGSFGEIGELQNVVYTGGDDAQLIAHDLRMQSKIWSTSYRHHSAGVVSILSSGKDWNNSNPHQLWTGSYDDNLRIFDLRLMDNTNPLLLPGMIPRTIKEENLGGGVWRLIPSPLNDDNLLACCMYDGARIVKRNNDDFEVSRYFKRDHESMCYGGDWSKDGNYVATCSFYDNTVQIWSPYLTT